MCTAPSVSKSPVPFKLFFLATRAEYTIYEHSCENLPVCKIFSSTAFENGLEGTAFLQAV